MSDPAQARPNAPIFYSELMRTVENLGLEKASGDQWLGTLNNLRGVKKEEMRWVGLPEWLSKQEHPVAKEQILDFLRRNEMHIEEVIKEHPWPKEWEVLEEIEFAKASSQWDYAEELENELNTLEKRRARYADHQLPGGEKYRELLLIWSDAKISYASPHFDEPNVLTHVRFNERTDIDGKRILFIEEIQSDWHQAGRQQGYREGKPRESTCRDYAAHRGIAAEDALRIEQRNDPSDSEWREMAQWMEEERREAIMAWHEKVPNAPFKTSWPELALKRMLRWGAEHGYDRVAWTTGDEQNKRNGFAVPLYLEHARYNPLNGKIFLWMEDEDRREVIREARVAPDRLGELLGRSAADRLLATPLSLFRNEHNNDMVAMHDLQYADYPQIGNPGGLKDFYDKVLPGVANRYLRQWGIRVSHSDVMVANPWYGVEPKDKAEAARLKNEPEYIPVTAWSFDITPMMQPSILQGQPLFMAFSNAAPGQGASRERRRPLMYHEDSAGKTGQESVSVQTSQVGRWLDHVRDVVNQEPFDAKKVERFRHYGL